MSGRHSAENPQVGADAGEYVAAMSDAELALMLNADARRSVGRCVTPRILRAASEEVSRRG